MEAQIVAQGGVGDREIVKNTTKNERVINNRGDITCIFSSSFEIAFKRLHRPHSNRKYELIDVTVSSLNR